MGKRKTTNFIVSDDDHDDGFNKSESDEYSDSEQEKKPKSRKKHKPVSSEGGSSNGPLVPMVAKKEKLKTKPNFTSESPNAGDIVIYTTSEGEKYIDLGKKKRATVRTFKGNTLIDIREFYGADGDEKPGKKGISLTVEQWEALKHSTGTIDSLFADLNNK